MFIAKHVLLPRREEGEGHVTLKGQSSDLSNTDMFLFNKTPLLAWSLLRLEIVGAYSIFTMENCGNMIYLDKKYIYGLKYIKLMTESL